MHKRLESDLISLAHSILKIKNKEDIFALKEKAKETYEKLSLLAFVEEYVNTSPTLKETKEQLLAKVEKGLEQQALKNTEKIVKKEVQANELPPVIVNDLEIETSKINNKAATSIEQPFDELENLMFSIDTPANNFKDDVKDVGEQKTVTLQEELKDTISVDTIVSLFDTPVQKSLNDKLSANIQIGLNDRIAFVKNLFDGSQEDFNRVVSQLNTYTSEKEAKVFITKMVKPDYNWKNKEEIEARFMEIIARKFM